MTQPTGRNIDKDFWEQRWKDKETGWDINGVSPPLKQYIDTLQDKNIAVLIPGCGNAYEAEHLLEHGFNNVTLIDISPTLVNNLKSKFKNQTISILNEDFFKHKGSYDLILEQTFFCAIEPSLRSTYVNKCYELLKPKGRIAGLLFNIEFEKEGPPFGGSKAEYLQLFSSKFNILQCDVCKTSIAPRLGNELFIEFEKK